MASSSVRAQLNEETRGASISEWKSLVRSWLTYLRAADKSQMTIEGYDLAVTKKFLPWLVDIGWTGPLGSLTAEHFREWLAYMKDQGLAGASRLYYRQGVRSFFRFLKDEGEIATDPFEGRGIPNPKPDNHITQTLSAEDLTRIIRVATRDKQLGIRDIAILSVLYDCGLRAAELCSLTVHDVDLDGMLMVRKSKSGRPRIVSLGKQALRAVDRYMRWRREYVKSLRWVDEDDTGDALFIGRTGRPITPASLSSILKKAAKNAGLDEHRIHPHMFRHSAATSLADSGMSEGDMRGAVRLVEGLADGLPVHADDRCRARTPGAQALFAIGPRRQRIALPTADWTTAHCGVTQAHCADDIARNDDGDEYEQLYICPSSRCHSHGLYQPWTELRRFYACALQLKRTARRLVSWLKASLMAYRYMQTAAEGVQRAHKRLSPFERAARGQW